MRPAEGEKGLLYDAVEDGSIETIRLGKQLRFRPSAIVRYLENCEAREMAAERGFRLKDWRRRQL
jgi:hypothetical protein